MKPRLWIPYIVSLIVGSGLVLGGCTTSEVSVETPLIDEPIQLPAVRLSGQPAVAIDSLMSDRVDETVVITGTVSRRVPLLEGWLYQMQDDTGSLWVLTSQPAAPEVGESATVEGRVRYETIAVEAIDASEVYLEEQSYRQTDG